MELNVFTTNVTLQDIPTYTTNIALEGQLLKLSFFWNERLGLRTLSVVNGVDECYLQNTVLHPNEPFELNSNAVFNDLPYSVILQKVGDIKKVGNVYNWSKDFILCFYRTVDIETEKLNVKYGITLPSTPTLPKPFGAWIMNQGYELVNESINYTAYKTNGISYYDSYAKFDLVTALVRSFHDEALQQYVAFKTAVEQLIDTVDWVLDPANNQITYKKIKDGELGPIVYKVFDIDELFNSPQSALNAWISKFSNTEPYYNLQVDSPLELVQSEPQVYRATLSYTSTSDPSSFRQEVSLLVLSEVNENPAEEEQKSIPLDVVAQQVISNAETGDETLKMLSEDYINIVANSVFDADASKQFVKLEDLIPQLEANKVLR